MFVIAPVNLALNPKLTAFDCQLYLYLWSVSIRSGDLGRYSGTVRDVAEDFGVSERTVKRSLNRLKAYRYIVRRPFSPTKERGWFFVADTNICGDPTVPMDVCWDKGVVRPKNPFFDVTKRKVTLHDYMTYKKKGKKKSDEAAPPEFAVWYTSKRLRKEGGSGLETKVDLKELFKNCPRRKKSETRISGDTSGTISSDTVVPKVSGDTRDPKVSGDTKSTISGDTSAPEISGDTKSTISGDTAAPIYGDTSAPMAEISGDTGDSTDAISGDTNDPKEEKSTKKPPVFEASDDTSLVTPVSPETEICGDTGDTTATAHYIYKENVSHEGVRRFADDASRLARSVDSLPRSRSSALTSFGDPPSSGHTSSGDRGDHEIVLPDAVGLSPDSSSSVPVMNSNDTRKSNLSSIRYQLKEVLVTEDFLYRNPVQRVRTSIGENRPKLTEFFDSVYTVYLDGGRMTGKDFKTLMRELEQKVKKAHEEAAARDSKRPRPRRTTSINIDSDDFDVESIDWSMPQLYDYFVESVRKTDSSAEVMSASSILTAKGKRQLKDLAVYLSGYDSDAFQHMSDQEVHEALLDGRKKVALCIKYVTDNWEKFRSEFGISGTLTPGVLLGYRNVIVPRVFGDQNPEQSSGSGSEFDDLISEAMERGKKLVRGGK